MNNILVDLILQTIEKNLDENGNCYLTCKEIGKIINYSCSYVTDTVRNLIKIGKLKSNVYHKNKKKRSLSIVNK